MLQYACGDIAVQRYRLHASYAMQLQDVPESTSFCPTTHMTGVLAFSAFRICLEIRSPVKTCTQHQASDTLKP